MKLDALRITATLSWIATFLGLLWIVIWLLKHIWLLFQ